MEDQGIIVVVLRIVVIQNKGILEGLKYRILMRTLWNLMERIMKNN